jgi:hypothetical protein
VIFKNKYIFGNTIKQYRGSHRDIVLTVVHPNTFLLIRRKRLVEQEKKEGCINKDMSAEVFRFNTRAIQGLLAQSGLSKKVLLDLSALFITFSRKTQ